MQVCSRSWYKLSKRGASGSKTRHEASEAETRPARALGSSCLLAQKSSMWGYCLYIRLLAQESSRTRVLVLRIYKQYPHIEDSCARRRTRVLVREDVRSPHILLVYSFACSNIFPHKSDFLTLDFWLLCANIRRLLCDHTRLPPKCIFSHKGLSIYTEIIGLFCKRALQKRRYSAKETCNFKEDAYAKIYVFHRSVHSRTRVFQFRKSALYCQIWQHRRKPKIKLLSQKNHMFSDLAAQTWAKKTHIFAKESSNSTNEPCTVRPGSADANLKESHSLKRAIYFQT